MTLRRTLATACLAVLATVGFVQPVQASPLAAAECPAILRCAFVPAAYAQVTGPADYGNYDQAQRPGGGLTIENVVIHDIEGSCQAAIDLFQDPTAYVSTHYVICADGSVTQMVRIEDVPWHAGNWQFNAHSIGIEIEGHAAYGTTEYTPTMYRSLAILILWLADRYDIPLDRGRILGHDNVPARTTAAVPGMHIDPGPFWNWQYLMTLLGAPVVPSGGWNAPFVTVAPRWLLSKEPVTGCWPNNTTCVPAGRHSTSIVYLRTEPRKDAPMLTDPVLGQGSTDIGNTAAKAYYGQKFAVASRRYDARGVWYQVWFAGQKGWFYSPFIAPTAVPSTGQYVTPKAGRASIPVFGWAAPDVQDYPADFVPPAGFLLSPSPLTVGPTARDKYRGDKSGLAAQEAKYGIGVGQRYAVVDANPPNDNYFSWLIEGSKVDPYDPTNFQGSKRYILIQFNGRQAFVLADDVVMS